MGNERATLALALSLMACSADMAYRGTDGDTDYYSEGDGAWGDTDGGADSWSPPTDEAPPEQEETLLLLEPAQAQGYVLMTNPDRATISRLDPQGLGTLTTSLGTAPVQLMASHDEQTLLTLQPIENALTLIDPLTLEVEKITIRSHMNRMVQSQDDRWVGMWHYASDSAAFDNASGAVSYNEISLVDRTTNSHFPMVVGFRPTSLHFTEDGSRLLAVSNAHAAILDLSTSPPTADLLPIADPLDPPLIQEVLLDPTGQWAYILLFGQDDLTLIDLSTQDVLSLPVPAGPTDIDLTADGTELVVVSRDAATITTLPSDAPWDTPHEVGLPGGEPFGLVELNPMGPSVLYTTTDATEKWATWDRTDDSFVTYLLNKPIRAVRITPNGETVLFDHSADDLASGNTPAPYAGRPGLGILRLDSGLGNHLVLMNDLLRWAVSADSRFAFTLQERTKAVQQINLQSLVHDDIGLPSVPEWLGTLDGDPLTLWVSQRHNLGRITFYGPDTQDLSTITGFELNSEIEE